MYKQEKVDDAYVRVWNVALKAANHLGHIPTDQPQYNPLEDPDVLAFIEQAVTFEVQVESQQVKTLNALELEL